MEINATVLGTRPSLAPGNIRSFTNSSYPVSSSSVLAVICVLADDIFACRILPTWKQLITFPLSEDERISRITSIFSDRNEIKAAIDLSGEDAQAFIDAIDEVNSHTALCPEARLLMLIEFFTLH